MLSFHQFLVCINRFQHKRYFEKYIMYINVIKIDRASFFHKVFFAINILGYEHFTIKDG